MALALRILSRFLFGSLLFSMMLLFLSVATSIRLFPGLMKLIHQFLRGFLILSYRLYHIILLVIQPAVARWFEADILHGNFRLAFCVFFSAIISLIPITLVGPSWSLWVLSFWILHGLFVGLAWDDIENPGGIQFGMHL